MLQASVEKQRSIDEGVEKRQERLASQAPPSASPPATARQAKPHIARKKSSR
jgi:ribosomal protein L12E/L44/L45/RPP1/RPP2